MQKKYTLFLLFIFFSLILNAQSSCREEKILNFHSDIKIDSTGRVLIKEHIKLYAAGESIKRGLVRSIPIYRENIKGKKEKININVLSVLRDGNNEDYFTEKNGGLLEIFIGNKDYILPPNEYKYTITYESYGHVGFFEDFDEIYWNVTGNDWALSIDSASATVHLPTGANYIQNACYTGFAGSTASNCSQKIENDSTVSFYTKSPLLAGEGFTIATSFTRDIVKRPAPPTKAVQFWEDYKRPILFCLFSLILGLYFCISLIKVKKSIQKKVVIPTFNPPNDWSPAVLRFLYKRRSDDKVTTSCILSMAVKGAVVIKQENKKYILYKKENTELLSPEEKQVYNILFSTKNSIALDSKNYSKLSTSSTSIVTFLKKGYDIKEYYSKNIKYKVISLLLSLSVIALYAYLCFDPQLLVLLFSIPFLLIGIVLLVVCLKSKHTLGFASFIVLGLGPLASGAMIAFSYFREQDNDILSGCFIYIVLLSTIFYSRFIGNYTQKGEDVRAEIAGFKMYMGATEEKRLNLLMPPKHTPELFEKMLPYAVALGVENKWSKKFNNVLKEASYQPNWYNGDLKTFSPTAFTKVYSSSSQNPNTSNSSRGTGSSSGGSSWSSGSSGGGHSGGGGGGGGGRGW